jgi:alpha-N-acetylglucosaminidase
LKKVLFAICAFVFPVYAQNAGSDSAAVDGLAGRLVPAWKNAIDFEIISSDNGKDVFELQSIDDKLIIRGNSILSQAVGLNWFLKYYCNTSVSWYASSPVQLPESMPKVPAKVRQNCKCEYRFFLNYCTFGYTMPWWGWDKWERLIDWMALNGVNMPLAVTGQEAVWQRVWKKFGLTDEQIRNYFTGPAHLPWHQMANIDKWGGPLPQSYIDKQFELQKKILTRERQLGMKPLLPAFAGHVPPALKELNPQVKITNLKSWGGFSQEYSTYFLDPKDPLFTKIQKVYLKEQTKAYGTDHFYGADPFNEMVPPSWEPEYLASVAKTIYSSMTQVDKDAMWVQMAWLFYNQRQNWTPPRVEAMLKAVPQDKMILLDYYCENMEIWKRTNAFYGQPYIWCYLGNFGGSSSIAGNIDEVNARITNVFKDKKAGNIKGIGSTLEALNPNVIAFELVFERLWHFDTFDMNSWTAKFADRRCGRPDAKLEEAWQILKDKIYIAYTGSHDSTIIAARPTLKGHGGVFTDPKINYDNKDLLKVWHLMLQVADTSRDSYQLDLVSVASQTMANYALYARDAMTAAYEKGDRDLFEQKASEFLGIIQDVNLIVASRPERLVGVWIADAESFGKTESERKYYEQNARNILSTWGQKGSFLNDYANRHWAGLIGDYYYGRWHLFISEVRKSMQAGKKSDEKQVTGKLAEFEWNWTLAENHFADKPSGDIFTIAKKMYDKYAAKINDCAN